ncbi:PQQ-dependent sugar dehydrogenase [Schlesneria sp.]|uniref:PQQ-dependent sugar dehydrogenase n=1 Tax=Schlesneria sp. TaxID=2762018 RepID=UPI002F0AEB2A
MNQSDVGSGLVWGFCALLFAVQSFAQEPVHPTAGGVDQSRFEVTVLATGLVQPMELAVARDGAVYFIELGGKLKVLDPVTRQVQIVADLTVTTAQENGLIGIALDPDFERNRWIYLQYSPPDFPGQHISRFTLQDGRLDLASEKVLLRYEEQRKECCHHAGSLHFGPRGELFIATGDNTHPHGDSQGFAPLDERPDRSPYDAQKSSSNTESYNGKILRIRPTPEGGYEIPEGNLFPADGSGGRPEIYVMGCRNPWRISVDSETGFLYWGDVGPDAGSDGPRGPKGYDEINQARRAGNFGWPYFIANNQPYADVDFATGEVGSRFDAAAPRNESPNNTGKVLLPQAEPALLYYPYGASPEFPELETGGRTACAGPVFHFSMAADSLTSFPAEYDRALFIYEWSRHWIKVVHFDENHGVKRIEKLMPHHRFVRPIDLEFGPDGALYLIEYGETWGVNADARLVRIDYVRGNRPPVVKIAAENNFGKQPLRITASSEGTFDKDEGDQLTYEWRVVKPAEPDTAPRIVSTEPHPVITIEEPGIYNVELTVTDSHGAARSATVPSVVGNQRPLLRFMRPRPGDFFDAEEPITYEVVVEDEEDGTNDDRQIDDQQREPLDADSPKRVSLSAVHTEEPFPVAGRVSDESAQGPMGLRRMKGSDCFNCHAVDQKRVGPPLLDIANKYRGLDGALDASVQRVLKGSTGVWGKIPMIPHSQHSPEEVREMVDYIFRLEPKGLVRVYEGFVGEIPVAPEEVQQAGHYRLIASYVDRGWGAIPPLTTSAEILLRPRLVEAETAHLVHGPQILNSGTAGGGKFIGAIDHGHYLKLESVSLERVSQLTFRVASAGAGGRIEIRVDQPDGPLLAATDVEVNGDWERWYNRTVPIQGPEGSHDLYVLFVHPAKAGGLMNLDSIRFER